MTSEPTVRTEYDDPGLILIEEKSLMEFETMVPEFAGSLRKFVTAPIGSAPGNLTYSMQYYDMTEPTVYCYSMLHAADHWNLVDDGFHLASTQMSCSLYALVDGEKQYYASDFSLQSNGHAWLSAELPAELVDWGIELEMAQEFRHESGDYSLYVLVGDSVSGAEMDGQLGRLSPDDFPPKVTVSGENDVICADGADSAFVEIMFPQKQGTAIIDFAPNTPLESMNGVVSGTTVTYQAGEFLTDRVRLDAVMESPSPAPNLGPCTMGAVFTETQNWFGTTTVWGTTQEHTFQMKLEGTTGVL